MSFDELEQHKANVARLVRELVEARTLLHAGLMEHSPFAVGDLVKVTTPDSTLDLKVGPASIRDAEPLPDLVDYGRVTKIRVVADELTYDIAPKTKDGGLQRNKRIPLFFDSRIEKVEVIH